MKKNEMLQKCFEKKSIYLYNNYRYILISIKELENRYEHALKKEQNQKAQRLLFMIKNLYERKNTYKQMIVSL